jgi:Domain of unknown function (DUF5615)
MTVALYMDVHVHAAITAGLRQRGVTVLTAQEDGADQFPDPDLLDRSTALGYALFTYDTDFLVVSCDCCAPRASLGFSVVHSFSSLEKPGRATLAGHHRFSGGGRAPSARRGNLRGGRSYPGHQAGNRKVNR